MKGPKLYFKIVIIIFLSGLSNSAIILSCTATAGEVSEYKGSDKKEEATVAGTIAKYEGSVAKEAFDRAVKEESLKNNYFEEINTDAIDGVIIPKEKAKEFYFPAYDSTKTNEFFTPNKEDVLRAEQKFIEYLAQYKPENEYFILPSAKDLLRYKRRYVGIILQGKEKICLDFFCEGVKNVSFQVMGGGNCYFNVLFDIESGNFSSLWVNGPA